MFNCLRGAKNYCNQTNRLTARLHLPPKRDSCNTRLSQGADYLPHPGITQHTRGVLPCTIYTETSAQNTATFCRLPAVLTCLVIPESLKLEQILAASMNPQHLQSVMQIDRLTREFAEEADRWRVCSHICIGPRYSSSAGEKISLMRVTGSPSPQKMYSLPQKGPACPNFLQQCSRSNQTPL